VKHLTSAVLLALSACTAHIAPPLPSGGSGAIKFALIGDAPYSAAEAAALDAMIEQMNQEDLAFVIHVGDITGGRGPCTDEWFEARKRQFEKFRHPFVIVPGDNDWVDCHRTGLDPMERLSKFRELFESGNTSLANRDLRLERQSGRYEEYHEHLRWIAGGVLENSGSSAVVSAKPKLDLTIDPTKGKPDGEPVMPGDMVNECLATVAVWLAG